MSQHIETIIEARSPMRFHDPELWTFMDQHLGPNLLNLSDSALVERLWAIEKNIQYLDGSLLIDFEARDDKGWTSFTWWLRARHWTHLEIARRGLSPEPSAIIPSAPAFDPELRDLTLRGKGILARVGQQKYLNMLLTGQLRFSPAIVYKNNALGKARADDEMKKSHVRPGQALTITLPSGQVAKPIGNVKFSSSRQFETQGRLVDCPYLFCSFSCEVDPRLIDEFPDCDAVLVIFDVDKFLRRAIQHLHKVMPNARKGLVINEYYDPYYIFQHELAAIRSKELEYALQREVRFVIDPGAEADLAAQVFATETSSFSDIAAVYDRDGARIDGTGPQRLWTS